MHVCMWLCLCASVCDYLYRDRHMKKEEEEGKTCRLSTSIKFNDILCVSWTHHYTQTDTHSDGTYIYIGKEWVCIAFASCVCVYIYMAKEEGLYLC